MPDRAAILRAATAPAGEPAIMPTASAGAAAPGRSNNARMARPSSSSYTVAASSQVSSGISAKNGNSAGATDAYHWAMARAAPSAAAWGAESSSAARASPDRNLNQRMKIPPFEG